MISRRDFGRGIVGVAGFSLLGGGSLALEGCSLDPKALINTVLTAAEAILKVAEPNATWLAPLQAAITALQQAELQWSAGSAVQIVIDALNTIQAVLAVIPVTEVYSPLIAVLVAGIEAALTYFVPPQSAHVNSKSIRMRVNNPYLSSRRVELKPRSFFHPTYQSAFKAQWNELADALTLKQCKI